MSITDVDRLYMRAAVALAERGLYTVTRNNPRVGCLLVKNGKVIGRGWHAKDGEAHAEVAALRSLQDGVSPKGSTAYVTLEPCCWEGRTAACTEQLINAKLNRVVVGREDPHPKVQGRGIQVLKEAGIPTEVLSLPELESLNPGQVSRVQSNRPWIRIKSAISMDGRTGMASGESQWITG
ncbi:MAG: bifunctional diaminohydroxyphosphoribosylaminopyrimidine deaminase/5-amino-6-(5-phosphoribosylamino)uracil reductase RibD, partial [Gammaproteobacteria bacterium]|nr:bifunctional diaminohydroxyphosphoribosylaminopyrimidine deaminase/5-amino-6-(5-phosphoribosylamino)uracil reductase RibD [Gammaproteobacteria bacterium]